MPILAALILAAGLACLAGSVLTGVVPVYLPLSTLVLAGIVLLARSIPKFLRVFVGMMAGLHLLMLALVLVSAAGLVPPGLEGYIPSVSTPIGSVGLAAVIYGISFLPVIRTIMRIADQYFESREPSAFQVPLIGPVRSTEGGIGSFMLATLIGINLFQVALSVRLSFFSRDLFNSFETKDASAFWYQLLWVFVPIATVHVIVALTEVYMGAVLRIRWRRVLNDDYVNAWLGDGTHYRLQLGGVATDNPDQRIAEDLRKYVDTTYTLSIQLLSQFATLVSFVAILWAISRGFTFPGTDVEVPGMLVWFAIIYAVIGTWITHLIGRPLIPLNFQQERYEADYRFALARFREYSEQIALLEGEKAEAANFSQRFRNIVGNYMDIVRRTMKLNSFTLAWFQANVVVPYLLTAPYYFAGKITLGQMQQVVGAFGRVDAALTFFISAYSTLADYKAVLDRLTTFESGVARAQGERRSGNLTLADHDGTEVRVGGVTLAVPDGREIARVEDLSLRPGETTLLTGASGSGKSTLFRALAGIWPFGKGRIGIPRGKTMMVLPQRPYLPIGSLRAAVAYPSLERGFSDGAIAEALRNVKLPHLAERLDDVDNWSQRLSGGEQQRLALARALLAKPDWLFLDEATAALDEPTEEAVYRIIRERLPQTTIVSIGHRSTLGEYHERRIDMRAGEGGLFAPVDVKRPVPAQ